LNRLFGISILSAVFIASIITIQGYTIDQNQIIDDSIEEFSYGTIQLASASSVIVPPTLSFSIVPPVNGTLADFEVDPATPASNSTLFPITGDALQINGTVTNTGNSTFSGAGPGTSFSNSGDFFVIFGASLDLGSPNVSSGVGGFLTLTLDPGQSETFPIINQFFGITTPSGGAPFTEASPGDSITITNYQLQFCQPPHDPTSVADCPDAFVTTTDVFTVTVAGDTTPPDPPTIDTLNGQTIPAVINDNQPTFAGDAETSSTVVLSSSVNGTIVLQQIK